MAQETVLIDFQVDYTELTNAQQELSKTGKVDTKAFDKIQGAITETAADTQGLIKQFKEVGTASVKMGKSVEQAFSSGIQDALSEAGVSMGEFSTALVKANKPAVTLKKELRDLKEALARAKAEGKDTGVAFDSMRAKAGKLADAINDANAEIKNAGSDTRGLDNVVGSISALAGGYAAVQGAAALFGDESEELQKTLVKVNGAMALASGLQQVMNALQKEGALVKLADTVATGAQTAAMTLYTFVTTGATVAARIFKATLLATGIGAIIVLVVALVQAMSDYGDETADAAISMDTFNSRLEFQNELLDSNLKFLQFQNKISLEKAKQRGASEKELNKIIIDGLKMQAKGYKDLAKDQQEQLNESFKNGKLSSEARMKLIDEISANSEKANDAERESLLVTEQFKTKLAEDERDRKKKQREEGLKFLEQQKKELEATQKEALRLEMEYLNKKVALQIKAIDIQIENEFRRFESEEDLRIEALAKKKKDAEDWATLNQEFQDSLVKSSENAAAKMIAAEKQKRDELVKTINTITFAAEAATRIFSELSAQQTVRDQLEIDGSRRKVEDQLRAGLITQKAAEARLKQIDQQERAAKTRAAQRDKQAAVFTALIAIPKAFLQGLGTGGPILGAVYAALAAVEAALIIARPVPKFFRGKKDSYAGPGIVADMGSELVERDGRMFLYTKPTQTYLGAKDKVYTAAETRKKLHNSNLNTTVTKHGQQGFDYDRFAKSIPAASLNVNINKDGITEWVTGSQSRTNYMDNRYRSK